MPIYAWVQDPPQTSAAAAQIAVSGGASVAVRAAGAAAVSAAAAFRGAAAVAAAAGVAVAATGQTAPRPVAAAAITVTAVASSQAGVAVSTAPATAAVSAAAAVVCPVGGAAAVAAFGVAASTPAVLAAAALEFIDFGAGSDPVFPFRFPMLFVGEPRAEAAAEAVLTTSGSATMDAVAVTADAPAALGGAADAVLSGSVPIFPFTLPAAFAPPGAANQTGAAEVAITATSIGSAAATAAAEAPITATAGTGWTSVLPFRFPAQLGA